MKYGFFVFYGSFYYILVILWRADLLWKETEVFLESIDIPLVSYRLYQTNLPSIQLSTDWNRTRWWKLIAYTDVTPTTWLWQETLDNTEGAIKKDQSRETGNIVYTRQNKTNTQHNM
jgi:hypothetical protein